MRDLFSAFLGLLLALLCALSMAGILGLIYILIVEG